MKGLKKTIVVTETIGSKPIPTSSAAPYNQIMSHLTQKAAFILRKFLAEAGPKNWFAKEKTKIEIEW